MIDQEEPQRLFESPEAPADLRSLLARAHDDVPTAIEKAQLVKSTLARGAAERPPVHGRGSAMRWAAKLARRSPRLWSVAAIVGVGVGVGAGAWYVTGVRPEASLRVAPPPAAQTVEPPRPQDQTWDPAREQAGDVDGWRQAEPQEQPSGDAPRVARETPPLLPDAEAAPAVALPRDTFPGRATPRRRARRAYAMAAEMSASRSAPDRPGSERPAAQPHADAAPLPRNPAPAPPARAADQPRPAAAPGEASPAPVPTEGTIAASGAAREATGSARETTGSADETTGGADEATLLRSARQALARSPRRTLSLTNEHRRRYPHGILDQEREALAIEALIKLGRLDEARPRARAFTLAYPGSPHQARLERALTSSPALDTTP